MRPGKMHRFQIYLEPAMDTHLQRLADKTGRPKAELVRDGINLLLAKEAAKLDDALLEIVGMAGKTGIPDASEKHDEYLYVRPKAKSGKGRRP